MARIFAARQSSPGSSTVVFTVSLSVRFAANTVRSLSVQTAQRQHGKTRAHNYTNAYNHATTKTVLRLYGSTYEFRKPEAGSLLRVGGFGNPGEIFAAAVEDRDDQKFGNFVTMQRFEAAFELVNAVRTGLDQ